MGKFIVSIVSIGLKIMLIFSIAGMLGIETTSFLAIFGALLVGVGMALNGTLSHFASGVMLMIFKPFKVGDLVIIGDSHKGTVEAINAFNTTLATLDNKRIIIGNSNVIGNTITNISGQEIIGVELTYSISYGDSIDKAREIILEVGSRCPYILKEPEQMVFVSEHAASSIHLSTRPFCNSADYWPTYFFMQEEVKKAFDRGGITIPFQTIQLNGQLT